jgi:hypothetical protein
MAAYFCVQMGRSKYQIPLYSTKTIGSVAPARCMAVRKNAQTWYMYLTSDSTLAFLVGGKKVKVQYGGVPYYAMAAYQYTSVAVGGLITVPPLTSGSITPNILNSGVYAPVVTYSILHGAGGGGGPSGAGGSAGTDVYYWTNPPYNTTGAWSLGSAGSGGGGGGGGQGGASVAANPTGLGLAPGDVVQLTISVGGSGAIGGAGGATYITKNGTVIVTAAGGVGGQAGGSGNRGGDGSTGNGSSYQPPPGGGGWPNGGSGGYGGYWYGQSVGAGGAGSGGGGNGGGYPYGNSGTSAHCGSPASAWPSGPGGGGSVGTGSASVVYYQYVSST